MMKTSKTTPKAVSFLALVYLILMAFVYGAYIWIEQYRLDQSQYWLASRQLSNEDVIPIQLVGTWSTTTEVVFYALFGCAFIFGVYRSWRLGSTLKSFLIWNTVLIATIGVAGYIVSRFSAMAIGNLLQPLLLPASVLAALFLYQVWVSMRSSRNRTMRGKLE
ncbi:hypothetical protein ASD24_24155 [Paenibacillus sp. Root52]|uniref:hypothetical protein n=1 Tax=Paenibacillus sp. Root52 TaxID=1736552 RepID=UPI0006F59A7F|nr:hypothetical protein [Paenibacillus sp. Root52]KQY91208.1 hypothetical protein ASD24_24155 [Paenibacillus sp. Root52]